MGYSWRTRSAERRAAHHRGHTAHRLARSALATSRHRGAPYRDASAASSSTRRGSLLYQRSTSHSIPNPVIDAGDRLTAPDGYRTADPQTGFQRSEPPSRAAGHEQFERVDSAEGVGHRKTEQGLQRLPAERLRRRDRPVLFLTTRGERRRGGTSRAPRRLTAITSQIRLYGAWRARRALPDESRSSERGGPASAGE